MSTRTTMPMVLQACSHRHTRFGLMVGRVLNVLCDENPSKGRVCGAIDRRRFGLRSIERTC